MFKVLFLLFLIVPIIEISVLVQLAGVIGGWTTILLVICTAFLGAKMVKQQGLETLAQIKQKSATGHIPGEELFSGVCILISGVLLLTPGILTDVLGFALLTPLVRQRMAKVLKQKIHLFAANSGQGQAFSFTSQQFSSQDEHAANESHNSGHLFSEHREQRHDEQGAINNVIDGEFKRKD